MSLYDKLFPPKVYTLPNGKQVAKKRSRAPLWTILIIAFCALSIRITGFDMSVLVKRGNQFWVILGQMFPPETAYLPNIWEPIFDTIKMSLLGSFIGSCASRSRCWHPRTSARAALWSFSCASCSAS